MNKLEQLKKITKVVADTGDLTMIEKFRPQDATTNPSLILKASQDPHYRPFIEEALLFARKKTSDAAEQIEWAARKVAVNFGVEILKLIPGRVSTEVNAALSFDTEATLREAHFLLDLYAAAGIPKERILIKIAATFEGIRAAKILEREGVACNLTLLFHFAQALLCAEAGITLISPFVGRIYDWHKAYSQNQIIEGDDPGVRSVKTIYEYYKAQGYATIVMGASFRSIAQIEALAGCDALTISPALLALLEEDHGALEAALDPERSRKASVQEQSFTESEFRLALTEDAMTTEKLAEGIRLFCKDTNALRTELKGFLK